MKSVMLILTAMLLTGCGSRTAESQSRNETAPAAGSPAVVLVELFTSEGCASCPAAERALEFLGREQPVPNAEIVTLAFHVDYWDRLGWKDRFASPLFSARQESYAKRFRGDVFTPQMVVDGRFQFAGHDTGAATRRVLEAASAGKAMIGVRQDAGSIEVEVKGAPKHDGATIYFALVEDGLKTEVRGGENSGKTLLHTSVVRELVPIGKLTPKADGLWVRAEIPAKEPRTDRSLSLVVFVQSDSDRAILGTVKVTLE